MRMISILAGYPRPVNIHSTVLAFPDFLLWGADNSKTSSRSITLKTRIWRCFMVAIRVCHSMALLIHEMRVRGRWPFLNNRPISFPIPWQTWIQSDDKGSDDDHTRGNDTIGQGHDFVSHVIQTPSSMLAADALSSGSD
jgi:hypothetical protein